MEFVSALAFVTTLSAIFAFTSIIASHLIEMYAALTNSRGRLLHMRMADTLNAEIYGALISHPVLRSVTRLKNTFGSHNEKPAYISPPLFAQAAYDRVRTGRITAGESPLLYTVVNDAHAARRSPEIALQEWFIAYNKRVAGTYKRWASFKLFLVGLALATLFNIDAVRIARQLAAKSADSWVIGWPGGSFLFEEGWFATALGIVLSALAISLGAQFWFDLLSDALKLRASLKTKDLETTDGDANERTTTSQWDGDDDAGYLNPISLKEGELGSLSEVYETSNRGPGTVSTGRGDHGGQSYGSYQLSSKAGTLSEFMAATDYDLGNLKALEINSPQFVTEWKRLAAADAIGFAAAQHRFIEDSHYKPQVTKLKELGVDVEAGSDALKNVVWSTAVQMRDLTATVVDRATSHLDLKDPDWRGKHDSEETLISAIYDERGRTEKGNLVYFRRSSTDQQAGVARRFVSERQDAIRMYRKSKRSFNV